MEHFKVALATRWLPSLVALAVAVILWRLSDAAVTRFYARHFVSRLIHRVPTYASLTKSFAGLLIFFFLILELLNIWDVNVIPALWSAGAISVVIGIGAQAIVRDMLTGAFYLFEDTFDVGDGVELVTGNGAIKGTVEAVGLREVRVIDVSGALVSVPYGAIVYAANTTRLPSRVAVTVAVPLRTGVAALRQRVAAVAATAAKGGEVDADHVTVHLEDATADTATFSISFHVGRHQVKATQSRLREAVVASLQEDGLLPGGKQ